MIHYSVEVDNSFVTIVAWMKLKGVILFYLDIRNKKSCNGHAAFHFAFILFSQL